MKKETQAVRDGMNDLADDARALMAATADVTGEKIAEARERLAAALDSGKEMYGRAREQVIDGAKAADEAVRARPYQAIAIGVGAGVILGFLLARRLTRD